MAQFVTLDNVSTGGIFPDVNFEMFPRFLQQRDKSLLSELPAFTGDSPIPIWERKGNL